MEVARPVRRAGRGNGPGESSAPRPGRPDTKLRGPQRGVYYDLYVVLDIFSRYVVGWTVAAREDAQIATSMLAQAIRAHGAPGSVHADRGTSMTSKPVAQLLVDLGVARSQQPPAHLQRQPVQRGAVQDP